MSRVPLDPMARETPSPATDRLAALAELFPEAVCEGRIDLDRLRALLGEAVNDRPERYTFSWAGKRDAIRILAEPSRATPVARLPASVTVYRVHDPARDQRFLISLDDKVSLTALDGLDLERTDLFVCRDSALDDDTAANLARQCRLKVI